MNVRQKTHDFVTSLPRLEQASGLRAGDRKQTAVPQDAPGDVWRPAVVSEDHGGAANQPHRQRLRPRDLLGEIPAEALWSVLQQRPRADPHSLFFSFNLCCVPSLRQRDQTDEWLHWSLAQWVVVVNNLTNAPEAV